MSAEVLSPEVPQPLPMAPVSAAERITAIDVLRGFALLGILAVNIGVFALPEAAEYNPRVAGGFTGANFAVWLITHLLFEMKMMAIFSMLFGAGLVVMTGRAADRGQSLRGFYFRRVGWLLVFGLLHAYGLWEGDILVSYALCGFVLYFFRNLPPGKLLLWGGCVFIFPVLLLGGGGLLLDVWSDAGNHPGQSGGQVALRRIVESYYRPPDETQEEIQKEIVTYRDGYWKLFRHRAGLNVYSQTVEFLLETGPRVAGLMLLGMALMKLRVFTGVRSPRFYRGLAVFGYGVGLPIVGYGAKELIEHDFDLVYQIAIGGHYNYVGSVFVALGHVGVVLLACQAGLWPSLTRRLAAVGRTALSNYLLQTLIATTLFYGYGFGLFARLDRLALAGVVSAVWCFQLAVSPVWLRYFRFGPMEWLWRSLTYGRVQPLWGQGEG